MYGSNLERGLWLDDPVEYAEELTNQEDYEDDD